MRWVVFLLYCFMIPQSRSVGQAPALDALLQRYAYASFGAAARTGVAYQLHLPGLGGIKAAALRLRSGSLRKRGLSAAFHEFRLPPGIQVHPPVQHLMLVYQNLGNSSSAYYPLPPNYVFLSPVLALMAYPYHSATSLPPELHITASLHRPISITFPNHLRKSVPRGWVPKCASFYSSSHPSFTTFFSNSTCATLQQGHFSVVAHSPDNEPDADPDPVGVGVGGNKNTRIGWLTPAVGGGVVLLLLASGMLLCLLMNKKRQRRLDGMERAAECGETLHMTRVGTTKAPAAPTTRTLPTIESEYHLSHKSIT